MPGAVAPGSEPRRQRVNAAPGTVAAAVGRSSSTAVPERGHSSSQTTSVPAWLAGVPQP